MTRLSLCLTIILGGLASVLGGPANAAPPPEYRVERNNPNPVPVISFPGVGITPAYEKSAGEEGTQIEDGLLPDEIELVGGMVRDICYNNAAEYFDFGVGPVLA